MDAKREDLDFLPLNGGKIEGPILRPASGSLDLRFSRVGRGWPRPPCSPFSPPPFAGFCNKEGDEGVGSRGGGEEGERGLPAKGSGGREQIFSEKKSAEDRSV